MKKGESLLILAVTASLLAHILFAIGTQQLGKIWTPLETQDIEVIFADGPEKKESKKQIVSDINQLQKKVSDLENAVNRLSKTKVRVNEETQAAITGNKTVNLVPHQPINPLKPRLEEEDTSKRKGRGAAKKIDLTNKLRPQQISGFSTVSDYIPNVKFGSATALNADQFTYYTFFERIKTQLRPRWVSNIRSVASRLTMAQIRSLGKSSQYTELEVILDSKGYLKDVVVVRASDSDKLDQASVAAFERITPILNPPSGMVGPDGTIRIYYGFNVQLGPRPSMRK